MTGEVDVRGRNRERRAQKFRAREQRAVPTVAAAAAIIEADGERRCCRGRDGAVVPLRRGTQAATWLTRR